MLSVFILIVYKRLLTAFQLGGASFAQGRGDRIPTETYRNRQALLIKRSVHNLETFKIEYALGWSLAIIL
jgi:hypothetical protein